MKALMRMQGGGPADGLDFEMQDLPLQPDGKWKVPAFVLGGQPGMRYGRYAIRYASRPYPLADEVLVIYHFTGETVANPEPTEPWENTS